MESEVLVFLGAISALQELFSEIGPVWLIDALRSSLMSKSRRKVGWAAKFHCGGGLQLLGWCRPSER